MPKQIPGLQKGIYAFMAFLDSKCEIVDMPDKSFRIKSFISTGFEHVIAVHPHWHPETEILYILKGSARQQVNDCFITIGAGDIVIINRNQLHSTYSYQGNKCEILVVMFDSAELMGSYYSQPGHVNAPNLFDNNVVIKNPVSCKDEWGGILSDCILEIHEELGKKQAGYQYFIRSLLYRLGGALERSGLFQIYHNNLKDMQITRHLLMKTFELIDKSYNEEISLKKAASISNLSVPHFCRLFKKATGMTFNNYLSFYRVNKAEKMLHSNKTITEIALECGFGSSSSFIRSFKRYKKCTPTCYKKQSTEDI